MPTDVRPAAPTYRCIMLSRAVAVLLVGLLALTTIVLAAYGLGLLLESNAHAQDLAPLAPPTDALASAAAAWWQVLIAVPGVALGGAAAWWARGVYAMRSEAEHAIQEAHQHADDQRTEAAHVSSIEGKVGDLLSDVDLLQRRVGRVEGMVEVLLVTQGKPVPPGVVVT